MNKRKGNSLRIKMQAKRKRKEIISNRDEQRRMLVRSLALEIWPKFGDWICNKQKESTFGSGLHNSNVSRGRSAPNEQSGTCLIWPVLRNRRVERERVQTVCRLGLCAATLHCTEWAKCDFP